MVSGCSALLVTSCRNPLRKGTFADEVKEKSAELAIKILFLWDFPPPLLPYPQSFQDKECRTVFSSQWWNETPSSLLAWPMLMFAERCNSVIFIEPHFLIFCLEMYICSLFLSHFYFCTNSGSIQNVPLYFPHCNNFCEVSWAKNYWPKINQITFMSKGGLELIISWCLNSTS